MAKIVLKGAYMFHYYIKLADLPWAWGASWACFRT